MTEHWQGMVENQTEISEDQTDVDINTYVKTLILTDLFQLWIHYMDLCKFVLRK